MYTCTLCTFRIIRTRPFNVSNSILQGSLFHMIEIWEYETSRSRWEGFSQEQTYRLATLRKTINPVHTFEDGSTVNVKVSLTSLVTIYC